MGNKIKVMDKLYHGKDFEKKDEFSYKRIWGLKAFKQTHPAVMKEWIAQHRNPVDVMGLPLDFKWQDVGLAVSDAVESMTGWRFGEYKNFKL